MKTDDAVPLDELQRRRFLRLANGLVAGSCAVILHLSRVGVLALAAQQPAYVDNPFERMEHHLEVNDARIDSLDREVSHLEGGAEIAFSGILILNVLGFIKLPHRTRDAEEPRT